MHVIRAWDYAYRQARQGQCWRQAAIDRERFKKRISDVENVLKPIFLQNHREQIYRKRFEEKLNEN